ncbi:hypothetical protein NDU88_006836 [Pleurodeles waltl]|uniref:Uncharacterized protein n=1 Tax=Pleurodeles waltl TaxID=8319 RepID=A0AAV7LRX9_PLEWA|nr:hypothetical protein NDU88_006836 [Pleurodeles waltl]
MGRRDRAGTGSPGPSLGCLEAQVAAASRALFTCPTLPGARSQEASGTYSLRHGCPAANDFRGQGRGGQEPEDVEKRADKEDMRGERLGDKGAGRGNKECAPTCHSCASLFVVVTTLQMAMRGRIREPTPAATTRFILQCTSLVQQPLSIVRYWEPTPIAQKTPERRQEPTMVTSVCRVTSPSAVQHWEPTPIMQKTYPEQAQCLEPTPVTCTGHEPPAVCGSYTQKEKRYSLEEIEEMVRVNDQAEQHAKKMEAGKLEKWEQAFRLQARQEERQSPERRRTPKPTNCPQRHSPNKARQRREQQLKCYCCDQDFLHTDPCPALGQHCPQCREESHFEKVCQASQKNRQWKSRKPKLCHHAKAVCDRRDCSTSSYRSSLYSRSTYRSQGSESCESRSLTPISQDSEE